MDQTFSCRRAGLVAALVTFAAAAPGQAQSFAAGLTKSDAIIGAPSQLAAMMAAQSSGASVMPAMAYRAPIAAPTPTLFNAPLASLSASPTRPDIFNSVAVAIARTPLDARWDRVGMARVRGAAATFADGLKGSDERRRLEAVNAYVNARVAFTSDSRQFGVADRWSNANDTLARGRGDCEDYALAKRAMLRRAGFADQDLYFVVLKDVLRREDHAVLVVRSGGRFLVLDNGTNRLTDSAEMRDYRPVMTFTAGQRFTHGYRRSATFPVVLASYQLPARRPLVGGMPSSPIASR
jgi:predicted transglutaminase-like cysteine proteinase